MHALPASTRIYSEHWRRSPPDMHALPASATRPTAGTACSPDLPPKPHWHQLPNPHEHCHSVAFTGCTNRPPPGSRCRSPPLSCAAAPARSRAGARAGQALWGTGRPSGREGPRPCSANQAHREESLVGGRAPFWQGRAPSWKGGPTSVLHKPATTGHTRSYTGHQAHHLRGPRTCAKHCTRVSHSLRCRGRPQRRSACPRSRACAGSSCVFVCVCVRVCMRDCMHQS